MVLTQSIDARPTTRTRNGDVTDDPKTKLVSVETLVLPPMVKVENWVVPPTLTVPIDVVPLMTDVMTLDPIVDVVSEIVPVVVVPVPPKAGAKVVVETVLVKVEEGTIVTTVVKKIVDTIVEDQLREHESRGVFGDDFVALARSVYHLNDERARVKREINEALGSHLTEEKQYVSYEAKPNLD